MSHSARSRWTPDDDSPPIFLFIAPFHFLFVFRQYDLFVINLVLRLLKDEYPEYTGAPTAALLCFPMRTISSHYPLLFPVFPHFLSSCPVSPHFLSPHFPFFCFLCAASGNIHQLQGTVASAALFGAIVGQLVGTFLPQYLHIAPLSSLLLSLTY